MIEKKIKLDNIDLIKLYGTNNNKFNKIKKLFPDLRIVSRGEDLQIKGDYSQISYFEKKLNAFINHLNKYDSLTISQIERLVETNEKDVLKSSNHIILHSYNGKIIKAKTMNQRKMVSAINKNDMIFAIGPAGTGKTYTAVALAIKSLKEKKVKKIILTRPAVESGENLGYLPGDLKQKLDPYMQPLYDALFDMLPTEKLNDYIDNGIIQIAPLAFMRGRTLDNAFVILDEGQNTTEHQMKMFLTRMGIGSKFIINGDTTQIDLPKKQQSGLIHAKEKLMNIKEISFIQLDNKDIIRHKLITEIIKAYKNE
ncbi:MAG: phosphate starvation-inducible protein PhoH [Flavobacteriales bacterium]|nr:phosphate starvation-inducible protein PhoH [Flavobacteriales bacterium]|tara:strand:+ start:49969 stop:50901 length:933 start_codon:yes stop_codon:yes gene_type:complete